MLERLVLRPELSAFETALNERVAIIAGLEDERFTRPREIERGADDRLTVISEYVTGRRLSDVLDAAAGHGIVAGLDAGLGLLLELLPALARLHDAGLAHGALAPGRVMITPAGGGSCSTPSAPIRWSASNSPASGCGQNSGWRFPRPPASCASTNRRLGRTAMVAPLSVGRPLRDDDYPEGIPALRQEILEIASIRGSKVFADAVDKFFVGSLPLAGKRAAGPGSADEAAIDLRKLVRKELGINTCRTALLEFFQQVDAADAERIAAETAQQVDRARAETARLETQQFVDAGRLETERAEYERAQLARVARERAEGARGSGARRGRAGRTGARRKKTARGRAHRTGTREEGRRRGRADRTRAWRESPHRSRADRGRTRREGPRRSRAPRAAGAGVGGSGPPGS
jgi:hypothetical protein